MRNSLLAVAITVLLLPFTMTALAWSKDTVEVKIKATHAVTHEDRSTSAVISKGLMGATVPTKQVESFNLDTVINSERVLLVCDDPRGASLQPWEPTEAR